MNDPDDRFPSSSVTLSMLISESVYRLVVIIERSIRWFAKHVYRPYLLLFRVLIG